VTPEGRSAIAYWAAVSWHGLRFSATTIAAHEPGSPPRYWGRLSHAPQPVCVDGALAWRVPDLGFSVEGESRQPPFGLRLIEDGRGTADWECRACRARMTFRLPGGDVMTGLGYAERLTFDFPPWALRLQDLHWGRWIAADGQRSFAWIDWRGPDHLTAVFVDGVRDSSGVVHDEEVRTSGVVLAFEERTMLDGRSLQDILGRSWPVSRLLPKSWLALQDRKWLSLGTLEDAGAEAAAGWVIHEHVRFP